MDWLSFTFAALDEGVWNIEVVLDILAVLAGVFIDYAIVEFIGGVEEEEVAAWMVKREHINIDYRVIRVASIATWTCWPVTPFFFGFLVFFFFFVGLCTFSHPSCNIAVFCVFEEVCHGAECPIGLEREGVAFVIGPPGYLFQAFKVVCGDGEGWVIGCLEGCEGCLGHFCDLFEYCLVGEGPDVDGVVLDEVLYGGGVIGRSGGRACRS